MSTPTPGAAGVPLDDVSLARPRPRWGQRAALALMVMLALQVLLFLFTKPRLEWGVVAQYLTAANVLAGLGISVLLTAFGITLGTLVGTALALLKLGPFRAGRHFANFYAWQLRGTPLLIQLLAWYNLAYVLPEMTLGIPFGGPVFARWDTNELITPFVPAVLGLALNEATYMAEIMRAGILSVDSGQRDAARALDFTPARAFWRIVFPQPCA